MHIILACTVCVTIVDCQSVARLEITIDKGSTPVEEIPSNRTALVPLGPAALVLQLPDPAFAAFPDHERRQQPLPGQTEIWQHVNRMDITSY